jgi:catalase
LEQKHIADSLVFELSKVERPAIRERVVSHLPNIDATLADKVAKGLGMTGKLTPIAAAIKTRRDLKPSKALSIASNPPQTFAGRKIGVLVTEGTDRHLFDAIKKAADAEGVTVEVIAPTVGGVTASDGSHVEAGQKIGGGPSVVYDAVAVLPSEEGAKLLMNNAPAKDFISDAFAHFKFIAYSTAAMPLFEKAGTASGLDEGCIELKQAKAASTFMAACRKLRHWDREHVVIT